MRQLRCDGEAVGQGGWRSVCLEAGEEDAELVSELILLKNVVSSFALSRSSSVNPFISDHTNKVFFN